MPRSFGVVQLEVGNSYINSLGNLITIVKRHVRPSGWHDRSFDHYFTDESGQRYNPAGAAMKGNTGGLPKRVLRNLVDRALKVKVGRRYAYHWPDGQSVGRYKVVSLDEKGYNIIWDNQASLHIHYGCPINYDSVPIE